MEEQEAGWASEWKSDAVIVEQKVPKRHSVTKTQEASLSVVDRVLTGCTW